jgi:tRNA threonylcarbamoyl adenosine modification protein (Sua5/YciO/YrdC/YwlC family)
MARYLEVHPRDPQPRTIAQVVATLRDGGLVAYPTDSGYALGATMGNHDAVGRIREIRRLDAHHHYTLVCADFAQMGQLVKLDNAAFRAIKAATPGPYTFVLPATAEVPRRLAHPRKKTVGVRIPDHRVVAALLRELGEPLLSSTLILPGDTEPLTDGATVKETLDRAVDVVLDDGRAGLPEPTTVVDWSGGYPDVVREGAGDPARFRGGASGELRAASCVR